MFFQLNNRCNLKCLHCDFWKLDDNNAAAYLNRERRQALFAEFADLGGETVVTCGGEPMLDLDLYYSIAETTRNLGLKMFSVINGTRVANYRQALRIVRDGPTEITVSLDHYLAEEHDHHRGVVGSHMVAERAIRLMLTARNDLYGEVKTPKIIAMTIVREGVYRQLPQFFRYALGVLGVDKLKLNILQPSFGHNWNPSNPDTYYAEEMVKDPVNLTKVLWECDREFGLNLNPTWVNQVEDYFVAMNNAGEHITNMGWAGSVRTPEPICNTYDRNIMIDPYGFAKLCFAQDFGGAQISGPGDLTRFWHEQGPVIRNNMLQCRRPCGISHSVRREEATIKR